MFCLGDDQKRIIETPPRATRAKPGKPPHEQAGLSSWPIIVIMSTSRDRPSIATSRTPRPTRPGDRAQGPPPGLGVTC